MFSNIRRVIWALVMALVLSMLSLSFSSAPASASVFCSTQTSPWWEREVKDPPGEINTGITFGYKVKHRNCTNGLSRWYKVTDYAVRYNVWGDTFSCADNWGGDFVGLTLDLKWYMFSANGGYDPPKVRLDCAWDTTRTKWVHVADKTTRVYSNRVLNPNMHGDFEILNTVQYDPNYVLNVYDYFI